MGISKDNGSTQLVAGATTSYTLIVTNNGPATVTGATVHDTPNASLTCPVPPATDAATVACSGSGCPATPITYGQLKAGTAALGTLANGASVTLTVQCRVD